MVTAAGAAFGSVHLIACSSCHQLPVPDKEAMGLTGAQPAVRHYVFLLLSPELRALNLRKNPGIFCFLMLAKLWKKNLIVIRFCSLSDMPACDFRDIYRDLQEIMQ